LRGETVGLVARDEHLGWVSFSGDKNRDAPAVADGLRPLGIISERNLIKLSRVVLPFIVIQLVSFRKYVRN
jgi:hypothetical protein